MGVPASARYVSPICSFPPPSFYPTEQLLVIGPGMVFSLNFLIIFGALLAELLLVVLYFGYYSCFVWIFSPKKLSFWPSSWKSISFLNATTLLCSNKAPTIKVTDKSSALKVCIFGIKWVQTCNVCLPAREADNRELLFGNLWGLCCSMQIPWPPKATP